MLSKLDQFVSKIYLIDLPTFQHILINQRSIISSLFFYEVVVSMESHFFHHYMPLWGQIMQLIVK